MWRVSDEPIAPVSPREAEVLAAVGQHLSNAQIASRLHLSVRTVETHVSSLLRKLDAADRRELAAVAPAFAASADPSAGVGSVRALPATWTPFVGRVRDRADVTDALMSSRLVTLLGPGGVGKTRLAGVVAEDLAPTLPLGAAFVELVSVRPGFLVQAVAAVLGVIEQPGSSLQDDVVARLRHGRSLLVLDNCEHLISDVAEFLTSLLPSADDLLVLATSRERIGVTGERIVPLAGLSVIGSATGGAAESDAVRLFVDRARELDPGFDAEPNLIGDVCGQLDGMPLAIELAAARTAALGIAGLQAGLADRLRLLAGGRSADHRHRSMRAMLDWSHELLDQDERRALRRLGCFAGNFDIDSAATVTGTPVGELADLVGRLADKSLVIRRRADGASRWALLETVRVYAREKLAAAGEVEATRERYVQWAVTTAGELQALVEADVPWRDRFDTVADDLRAALQSAPEHPVAPQLARMLGHLAYARRFLSEARTHYLTAADLAETDSAAADDLRLAARVAQSENRGDVTFELLLASAERAAAAGDTTLQASVLAEAVSVGSRFPAIFEQDVPVRRLQELLATAEAVAPAGDDLAQAQVQAARAWTDTRLVEVPEPAAFAAALEAARRVDDATTISAMLDARGSVETMAGRMRQAYELSCERLALLPRLPGHHPRSGAELHDLLHMAVENAVTAGEIAVALELSAMIDDETAVPVIPTMRMSKSIVPLVLSGRFDEAIDRGRTTRDLWESAGGRPARWLAPALYAVTLALRLRGFTDDADAWSRFVLQRVAGEQTRSVHFQVAAMVTSCNARFALHEGRLDVALESVRDLPSHPDAWETVRHWYFDAYPWALAAEVAVVAGSSDADERLAAAEPAAAENRWAQACLTRARGRRSGDVGLVLDAAAQWERIGARYERACTLLLVPDRAAEGRAELEALGVAEPAAT
jgi:predicted ATPase/DNA-binding CsgD family transcriptional regulator